MKKKKKKSELTSILLDTKTEFIETKQYNGHVYNYELHWAGKIINVQTLFLLTVNSSRVNRYKKKTKYQSDKSRL